jgi:hypothetical protein
LSDAARDRRISSCISDDTSDEGQDRQLHNLSRLTTASSPPLSEAFLLNPPDVMRQITSESSSKDIEAHVEELNKKLREVEAKRDTMISALAARKAADLAKTIADDIPVTLSISSLGGICIELEARPGETVVEITERVAKEFGFPQWDSDEGLSLHFDADALELDMYVAQLPGHTLAILKKGATASEASATVLADEDPLIEETGEFASYVKRTSGRYFLFCPAVMLSVLLLIAGVVFGGIITSKVDVETVKLFDRLEPHPCQAFEATCDNGSDRHDGHNTPLRRIGQYAGPLSHQVDILFRLEEDESTPVPATFGNASVRLQTTASSSQGLHLLSSGDGDVHFSSEAGAVDWQIKVVDTSDLRHALPEMKYRALRVTIMTAAGQYLQASENASIARLAPLGEKSNVPTEWFFSTSETGRCCTLQAADMTTPQKFLGPPNGAGAVGLWTLESAHLWDDSHLPSDWVVYLKTPAAVGVFARIIEGQKAPSLAQVESFHRMPVGSLFGGDLQCYYDKTIPWVAGEAVHVFPDNTGMIQETRSRFGQLHLEFAMLQASMWLAAAAQLMLVVLLYFIRPEAPKRIAAVISSSYCLHLVFLTCLYLVACRFEQAELFGGIEGATTATGFAPNFSIRRDLAWREVWNASAPLGH